MEGRAADAIVVARVKRWASGQHVEQWRGMGLLAAETGLRKIRGYRLVPMLQAALGRAR